MWKPSDILLALFIAHFIFLRQATCEVSEGVAKGSNERKTKIRKFLSALEEASEVVAIEDATNRVTNYGSVGIDEVLGGQTPSERFSEIVQLGESHYHLRNVCVRPLHQGGLFYFYDAKQANHSTAPQQSVKICSEFHHCGEWKFQMVPSPIPAKPEVRTEDSASDSEGVTWVQKEDATAMVEPITGLSGWHLLHHLLSMTQVLSQQADKFQGPTVHLLPTFMGQVFRDKYAPLRSEKGFLFSPRVAPFWPLVAAIVPPNMELLQFDLLETHSTFKEPLDPRTTESLPEKGTTEAGSAQTAAETTALSEGGATTPPGPETEEREGSGTVSDMVCYESLVLGSPRMQTGLGYMGKARWWGEMQAEHIRPFRSRVLKIAEAQGLNSGFCEYDPLQRQGNRSRAFLGEDGSVQWNGTAPLLILVHRRAQRRFQNVDGLKEVIRKFGFRIQEVHWEDMELWEQIRVARTADVMLGAHGNGLTHVFWMREGSVLVEIFPPGDVPKIDERWNANKKSNYGSLASFAGVHHVAFRSGKKMSTTWKQWRSVDVVVPTKKLVSVFSGVVDKVDQMKSCLGMQSGGRRRRRKLMD